MNFTLQIKLIYLQLPNDCDANSLKAKYDSGVLEVTCKKLANEKRTGKLIQVV